MCYFTYIEIHIQKNLHHIQCMLINVYNNTYEIFLESQIRFKEKGLYILGQKIKIEKKDFN